MLVNEFGFLNGLFSTPEGFIQGGGGTPSGQPTGQPSGQPAGQTAGQVEGQVPAPVADPIGDVWETAKKSYAPQILQASLSTVGDYFSDKADPTQTAQKLIATDKGKTADLFYAMTDMWAGHPNYIQYLVQYHPDAAKQIAAAAGFVPKGQATTVPAQGAPPAVPSYAPPVGGFVDEDQAAMQKLQQEVEAARNDARVTKEQLDAMVEQNAQTMYIQGEQRLDGDLDSYVAQKVAEALPGAKPEVIRTVQMSIKGMKTSDMMMKDLYYRTLSNRFSGNELTANNNFENLKRVADQFISTVVPVFGGQVIAQNTQQHQALQAAARRVSPSGAALPPTAQAAAQPARIDLVSNALANYDRLKGTR